MRNQLINNNIQDVINEVKLYKGIMIISIALVFALITCLFIAFEKNNELKVQIEHINNSYQSLKANMIQP